MNYLLNLMKLVLVCFLLSSCLKDKKVINDWESMKLQSTVMSISETHYKTLGESELVKKGEMIGDLRKTIFDEQGDIIEYNNYNSTGELSAKITHKYDEKHNLIQRNITNFDGSMFMESKNKFDENFNKIESEWYSPLGDLIIRETFTYDENGYMTTSSKYGTDKKLSSTYTYEYDKGYNLITKKLFDANGGYHWKYVYVYDENSNRIQTNGYYMADDYIAEGTLKSETTFRYKYDEDSNWIYRLKSKNGVAEEITERTLEYFE